MVPLIRVAVYHSQELGLFYYTLLHFTIHYYALLRITMRYYTLLLFDTF